MAVTCRDVGVTRRGWLYSCRCGAVHDSLLGVVGCAPSPVARVRQQHVDQLFPGLCECGCGQPARVPILFGHDIRLRCQLQAKARRGDADASVELIYRGWAGRATRPPGLLAVPGIGFAYSTTPSLLAATVTGLISDRVLQTIEH